MTPFQIFHGDSAEILKQIEAESAHSLVTDPPAGIGLNHLEWDQDKGGRDQWIKWLTVILSECYRILKPGSHGLIWAIPRTSHWTAFACENSGFLVKDVITHVFGSGFPKSMNVEKAIQSAKYLNLDDIYKVTTWIRQRRDELGLRNQDIDEKTGKRGAALHWTSRRGFGKPQVPPLDKWLLLKDLLGPAPREIETLIAPAREKSCRNNDHLSQEWQGWGTALKPSSEHWILIQKPISEHNIAANILKHGTGAINIDASRVRTKDRIPATSNLNFTKGDFIWDLSNRSKRSQYQQHELGRHPANFMLTKAHDSSCPEKILNLQANSAKEVSRYFRTFAPETSFIYSNKFENGKREEFNSHPTVKSLRLMRYLTKMVTPPEGLVLDPFMGSGSTGVACLFEKFRFVGIEKEESYFSIAEKRLKNV